MPQTPLSWPFNSLLATINWAATAIFLFLVAQALIGFVSANIRTFIQKHGWDNFLVRALSSMIADWETTKKRWWLWLSLGAFGGLTGALWLGTRFPSAQSNEDTVLATASIRDELDATKQQVVSLQSRLNIAIKERDAATLPSQTEHLSYRSIGGISAFYMVNSVSANMPGINLARGLPPGLIWGLVMTTPPHNEPLANLIYTVFSMSRLSVDRPPLPDPSKEVGAPVFPEPPDDNAIVIHGETEFTNTFIHVVGQCFVVKRDRETLPGLDKYYSNTPNVAPVWIEFGKGNPVKPGCEK